MIHKKIISKLILLTCIVLFTCNNSIFCQWNPNYSIGTVTGKYVFSYSQIPDQLAEIISPVYTATTLTYKWESYSSPIFPSDDNSIPSIGSSLFQRPYLKLHITGEKLARQTVVLFFLMWLK